MSGRDWWQLRAPAGIIATIDLPNLPKHAHERLFWTLTAREMAFAGGAMVLAGSLWSRRRSAGGALITSGRFIVACTFVFYAIEHFLFPLFAPGVPLEQMTPAWGESRHRIRDRATVLVNKD